MFANTFGLSNGVITIVSLITGLYAVNVDKIGIVAAILSLLIVDPLSDAYSLYVAKTYDGDEDAYLIGKTSFLSQFLVQVTFLLIIIFSPNLKIGLFISYIIGLLITIAYGVSQKIDIIGISINILCIVCLVIITYLVDRFVYKHFKK